jgi:hypothetical protein
MEAKWKIFDYQFDSKKKTKTIRWICLECKEVCVVELPPRKTPYHCTKGGSYDRTT